MLSLVRLKNSRIAFAAALCAILSAPAQAATLTILHNNDGESLLLERTIGGQPYAGAARFVTAVEESRAAATLAGRDVITISSGDNFLAGPAFTAGRNVGRFFDAEVLNAVGYDAVVLGNHEFDFGPGLLADFISQTDSSITFLSANLNFSGEASLQALADVGRIASSKIVTRGSETYGIIGATTDQLPFISSPGGVTVNPVIAAVQAEVAALQAAGVNKIIFASHLQRLDVDVATIGALAGIDLVIAGGSDALLRSDLPEGATDIFGQTVAGPYPLERFDPATNTGFSGGFITDSTGKRIPVVTTAGEYRYLGRFDVTFDDAGNLTSIDSGSQAILIDNSFEPDSGIVETIITPVRAAIASLAANIIGVSEVALNGIRDDVRSMETNLGNLVADAFIFQARELDALDDSVLTGNAVVSLTNAGGIRNNTVIPAGNISELTTLQILPFSNFLSVFNDVTPEQLKGLLERAIEFVGTPAGSFGQVGGFVYGYDARRAVGDRVVEIRLADGTVLFDGESFTAGILLDLVTIDFLARGGDGYPFGALDLTDFRNLGISYQEALFKFIEDGLGGRILARDYAPGGEGRIFDAPEPAAFSLLALSLIGIAAIRRRRAAA